MERLSISFAKADDQELLAAYDEYRNYDPIKGGKIDLLANLCITYGTSLDLKNPNILFMTYLMICEELATRYHYLLTRWEK